MAVVFKHETSAIKTPGGFMALVRKEKWSDRDALLIAASRVNALERLLCEKIEYQSLIFEKLTEAEKIAELATYRENIANERVGDRDEIIGRLEEKLALLGVNVDPFSDRYLSESTP